MPGTAAIRGGQCSNLDGWQMTEIGSYDLTINFIHVLTPLSLLYTSSPSLVSSSSIVIVHQYHLDPAFTSYLTLSPCRHNFKTR